MPSKKYSIVPDNDQDSRIPVHNEEAFVHGLLFQCKYIGTLDVPKPNNRHEIVSSMRRIRYEFKSRNMKKRKVTVSVSTEGVKCTLRKKKKKKSANLIKDSPVIMESPVYRVFYVSHDSQDLKIFSYISREGATNIFKCNVFKAYKKSEAMHMVRTIGQMFEVCHNISLRAKENQKKEEEEAAVLVGDGQELDLSEKEAEDDQTGTSGPASPAARGTTPQSSGRETSPDSRPPGSPANPNASSQSHHSHFPITNPGGVRGYPAPPGGGNSGYPSSPQHQPALPGLAWGDNLVVDDRLPLSSHHQVQLMSQQYEHVARQAQHAESQLGALRERLAIETQARQEGESRVHQLTLANSDLLAQISQLLGAIRKLESANLHLSTSPVQQFLSAPLPAAIATVGLSNPPTSGVLPHVGAPSVASPPLRAQSPIVQPEAVGHQRARPQPPQQLPSGSTGFPQEVAPSHSSPQGYDVQTQHTQQPRFVQLQQHHVNDSPPQLANVLRGVAPPPASSPIPGGGNSSMSSAHTPATNSSFSADSSTIPSQLQEQFVGGSHVSGVSLRPNSFSFPTYDSGLVENEFTRDCFTPDLTNQTCSTDHGLSPNNPFLTDDFSSQVISNNVQSTHHGHGDSSTVLAGRQSDADKRLSFTVMAHDRFLTSLDSKPEDLPLPDVSFPQNENQTRIGDASTSVSSQPTPNRQSKQTMPTTTSSTSSNRNGKEEIVQNGSVQTSKTHEMTRKSELLHNNEAPQIPARLVDSKAVNGNAHSVTAEAAGNCTDVEYIKTGNVISGNPSRLSGESPSHEPNAEAGVEFDVVDSGCMLTQLSVARDIVTEPLAQDRKPAALGGVSSSGGRSREATLEIVRQSGKVSIKRSRSSSASSSRSSSAHTNRSTTAATNGDGDDRLDNDIAILNSSGDSSLVSHSIDEQDLPSSTASNPFASVQSNTNGAAHTDASLSFMTQVNEKQDRTHKDGEMSSDWVPQSLSKVNMKQVNGGSDSAESHLPLWQRGSPSDESEAGVLNYENEKEEGDAFEDNFEEKLEGMGEPQVVTET